MTKEQRILFGVSDIAAVRIRCASDNCQGEDMEHGNRLKWGYFDFDFEAATSGLTIIRTIPRTTRPTIWVIMIAVIYGNRANSLLHHQNANAPSKECKD